MWATRWTPNCSIAAGDGVLPDEMVDGTCLKGDQRTLLEQMPELQRDGLAGLRRLSETVEDCIAG